MIDSNKFAVMKFFSRHKLLFASLLIVWIIGMIFTVMLMNRNGHTKIKLQRTSHLLVHPLQHNRLPPPSSFKMAKVMHYCNPPNSIEIGQEGRAPENYSLEFVTVVIRHGDRSPLRPIKNQSSINCSISPSHPYLNKYLSHLKSIHRPAKSRYPFSTFPLYPSEKRCSSAQMTIIGSQQHLQLGNLLGKVYNDKFKLLSGNWSSEHIKIYSTAYSRTFQSAIAFLYGFLPSFNFSNIKIIPSADTRFCMDELKCMCPLLDHLQKIVDRKMKKLLNSHAAVVNLLHFLNPIVKFHPNHTDIVSPMAMFDSVMGYVCHGSHLPCKPGSHHCVTIDHVRKLITFLDWEGRQFVGDNSYKKTAWLKMHGFLKNVVQLMESALNGKAPHRFALFSGHDVTLTPLATMLGFDDGIMPPYASRIVFELYSENGKSKHVIKVLYNGKDVTKYIPFCKMLQKNDSRSKTSGLNICLFENFVKFVRKDFFRSFNASSFEAACALSQTNYSS